jgi:hypothetical protein
MLYAWLKTTRGRVVMLFVNIGIAAVFLLLSSTFNPVQSAPKVHWTPDTVNAIVEPGGHTEVEVSLNAVKDLGNVVLRIVPELDPFVDVTPSTLNNVKAGDMVTVHITIQAAASTPVGLFDGTIQVRQKTSKPGKGKVLARPLPIQVLIRREEGIAGVDADGNGVWDYIDQYINTTYPDSDSLRAALRQDTKAIEGGLLHADDKNQSLKYATDMDRAIECVFFLRPDDADKVLAELEATILNNKVRSRTFIVFSEQSAGQVFPSAPISERGASCAAE